MFIGTCAGCGGHRTARHVDVRQGQAHSVCEACGHAQSFVYLPLYVAVGASGAGKTTLCREMPAVTDEIVCLDGDVLLRPPLMTGDWDAFRAMWMELAINIAQSGRPVLLLMGGMPEDFLRSPAALHCREVRVLGICAGDDDIRARLRARPSWRASGDAATIERMLAYNQAVSAIDPCLNTSGRTAREAAHALWAMIAPHVRAASAR